jgi:hypothetical protein
MVTKLATHGSTYVGDLNAALQDELRKLNNKQNQMTGGNGGELTTAEEKRFEEFFAKTEGEIQSSIMKTTLDTIQTTWLQPMIQLKVEKRVSKIGSQLAQKYCPSILPEGFDNSTDQKDSKNSADDEMPSKDQWIDEMGNILAGPVEMQNTADAIDCVLEMEDNTEDKQYTKGSEGNTFRYNPEGNPYSDKPVVKMSFMQNEDGTSTSVSPCPMERNVNLCPILHIHQIVVSTTPFQKLKTNRWMVHLVQSTRYKNTPKETIELDS